MSNNHTTNKPHSLCKQERLCLVKSIEALFSDGQSINHFPFKIVYSLQEPEQPAEYPVKLAVSVPKRNFKRAVKRNFIKRRMREAYRLNKHIIYNRLQGSAYTLHIMIIYVSTRIAEYAEIEQKLVESLIRLEKVMAKNLDICSGSTDSVLP